MGTKVPNGIKFYMTLLKRMCDADVYLSGGALCRHSTNDFDLVVISKWYSDALITKLQDMYSLGIVDSIQIYEAYGSTDKSEDDGKFHTKAVCHVNGTKVDMLFSMQSDYDIDSIMDNYPLSIQMRSMDINGNLIVGDKFREDKIVVYDKGSAERKYKKYYPDTEFIYADT